MSIQTVFISALFCIAAPLFFQCAADLLKKTELPAEMPAGTKMSFHKNGGMLPTFKEIKVSEDLLVIESRGPRESQPQSFYAEIAPEDARALYRVFVENRFDRIKNDKRDGIVYDAPSESIYIRAGKASKNISYGPNSPLSGSNLRGYKAVKQAIEKLAEKYQDRLKPATENKAVFRYDPARYGFIFKNARPLDPKAEDFALIDRLVAEAVEKYNAGQTGNRKIKEISQYKFQLIFATTTDGQNAVWVNAFCRPLETDWKNELLFVEDGGSCYFSLKIDLRKSAVYDFQVNGEA